MEKGSINDQLYDYYKKLDRSLFLEGEYKDLARLNEPLPIGLSQTISQPSLVLEMTTELDLNKDCKVLEIGTGSGYQTAFLAEFSKEVYTVERLGELSQKAQERIRELGYTNVNYKIDDGSKGWLEFSPYDRIIVTAGGKEVPEELVDQLKAGGKMIIPAGKREFQDLILIQKDLNNNVHKESLGKVRFVELKGKYGWN